ncbi:hypothetical protein MHB48_17455 [Psychrobacillus sp. FSL H8-0483]|uniref:hypothetical protein n=1 Tax=Psychrobacillus sp. FSL H8-0483 TaxID=2921389 RepID=UPI00315A3440
MRIFVGSLSIFFGIFFTALSVDSFGTVGNLLMHGYGYVLIILGALVLSNRKNKKASAYARPMGIAIAMILFGIALILKTLLVPSSDGGRSFGIFHITLGVIIALVDYLEER